ncbi:MAG: phage replisome organizer N-terminal domain-containing protein [Defluviitaleaceae bacterium]|nr:phage replisome organizer N-terminal domain-containing protein [Defluviitaleaceae bacterium]
MRHIKLPVHFFEDDRLKAIRSQKDGDAVILLYTMLIIVAVKSDMGGRLMLCDGIPYDEKILSGILGMNNTIIKNGLDLLVRFGLLNVEDNVFSLVNYNEFADTKGIKERRQNADRQAKFKAKQSESDVTVTDKKITKTAVAKS